MIHIIEVKDFSKASAESSALKNYYSWLSGEFLSEQSEIEEGVKLPD